MRFNTDQYELVSTDDTIDNSGVFWYNLPNSFVSTDAKVYWGIPFNDDLLDLIARNKLIWNDAIHAMIKAIELQSFDQNVKNKIKEIAKGLLE